MMVIPSIRIGSIWSKGYRNAAPIMFNGPNIPTEKQGHDFYNGFIDLIVEHSHRFSKDEAGRFARWLLREIDCSWTFLEMSGVESTKVAVPKRRV